MKESPVVKERIIEVMESGIKFGAACSRAGIDRTTGWRWRKRDLDFHRRVTLTKLAQFVKRSSEKIDRLEKKYWYLLQD